MLYCFRRHVDVLFTAAEGRTMKTAKEFWAAVGVSDDKDACWLWRGVRGRGAKAVYPSVMWQGTNVAAHRLALAISLEVSPTSLGDVLHSCDRPHCCNPHHLREGSHAENMADSVERGRRPRGTRLPWARLTEDKVREARRLRAEGAKVTAIARMFGISQPAMSAVLSRRVWRHVA